MKIAPIQSYANTNMFEAVLASQALALRPHCTYHSQAHPRQFLQTVVDILEFLKDNGAFEQFGFTDESWLIFQNTMVVNAVFHDIVFDLNENNTPSVLNEELSLSSAYQWLNAYPDLIRYAPYALEKSMLHTKVTFDPSNGVVASPIFDGTDIHKLAQLVSEIGDKIHLLSFEEDLQVEELFNHGFEDNLRLYIEMQLRKPEFIGNREACYNFVRDLMNSDQLEAVFCKVTEMMYNYFDKSVLFHVRQKTEFESFAAKPSVAQMLNMIYYQYSQLSEFTKVVHNTNDGDLTKLYLAKILAEYDQ